MRKGDFVIIKSVKEISQSHFEKSYPQGLFAKVIDVPRRLYSRTTGKIQPQKYVLRVYGNKKKWHKTTTKKHLKKL